MDHALLQTHQIVGLLQPAFQRIVQIFDRSNGHGMDAPPRAIVLCSNHPRTFQPSMQREVGHEVILARRQPGEADAGDADEARFLRNDLNVTEGAQDIEESPRETDDRRIRAREQRLERELSARMPQIPGDQARTAPRAGPHRMLRAWHVRSLPVSGSRCDRPVHRLILRDLLVGHETERMSAILADVLRGAGALFHEPDAVSPEEADQRM